MAWTLAANSATVKPLRGRRQRQGGAQRVTHPLFVEVDTADAGGAERRSVGQLIEDAVAEESGVHAVQGGGESFGDAGQLGHDLGELLDHAPATQLRGVVRDRLEPQHAFALSVLGTPVKVGIRWSFPVVWPRSGHVPERGGPQSGSRWSARSAARTNDLEAGEDPPQTWPAGGEAKTLWFKSSAASCERRTCCGTSRVPAPSLTRKSDGEWAAEGTRRSRVMWYCCGFGIMRRHR